MFADDCKIYCNIASKSDEQRLQKDIDALCQWSNDWLLRFNTQKCKVVSYGPEKVDTNYQMEDGGGHTHQLTKETSEKDLGVLFTNKLNFEQHINNTVNKVNQIIGLIRRKFIYMDKSMFLTLYKALIRSHLTMAT